MEISSASTVVSYEWPPLFFSSSREDAPDPASVSAGEKSTTDSSGTASVGWMVAGDMLFVVVGLCAVERLRPRRGKREEEEGGCWMMGRSRHQPSPYQEPLFELVSV